MSTIAGIRHVALEIAYGRIEAGLVYASHWELSTETMKEKHAEYQHLVRMANAVYGSYDSRYGVLSPVHYYAMCTQRYMFECGITPEQVAALPVVLRENAALNPHAMYRDPITVEDVLASRMLSPPIHWTLDLPRFH